MDNKKIKIIIGIFGIVLLGILLYVIFRKNVTTISLNKQYIKIYVGNQVQLEATTNLKDTDIKLIWTSTNLGVASVTPNGIVIANNPGEAKIVVKTEDGKITNSCIVLVAEKEVESFELNRKDVVLKIGDEVEIMPVITPDDLDDKVTWTSSDTNVATVDENGKVKGLNNGIAIIKASLLGKEANSVIYVGVKATSIKIDGDKSEIELEKSIKLNVVITPEDALLEKIIWESSDSNILEVDNEGNITAKNLGMVMVTAKTEYSNLKDVFYVTVIKKNYEVKYEELNKTIKVVDGETLGDLPTMSKYGYKFLGWYTKASGGTQVTAKTQVTSNMTLYPHWEKLYILPDDTKKTSGFTITASYSSDTLKYKILARGGEYYSLIWVDDAYDQFKSALAYPNGIAFLKAEYILENEIKNKGYQNKGLISVNASFTWYDRVSSPLFVNDGKIIRDVENKKYPDEMYAILALTKERKLALYEFKSNDYAHNMNVRNQMLNDGVKDVFATTGGTDTGAKVTAHRTQICQVDTHNFVLSSGHGRVRDVGNRTKPFGCSIVYNLDGGGSRKLYYKTNSSGLIKLLGGSRPRPDMLYFVEK